MKVLSYFFFYTYTGLVIVAGFWGAFINPVFDFYVLFGLDLKSIADAPRINLVSQYRFLRALEFGFGLFSYFFSNKIFSMRIYNHLFLTGMLSGVLARVLSLIFDGSPSKLFYFFLIYELIGVILIFLYTRNRLNSNAAASTK
jgi:hypothetical protein